jgi:hypothetical protein
MFPPTSVPEIYGVLQWLTRLQRPIGKYFFRGSVDRGFGLDSLRSLQVGYVSFMVNRLSSTVLGLKTKPILWIQIRTPQTDT